MVVLAIIAVLSGLLLAAVQRARDAANRTVCTNHLRQIGLALHEYHGSYAVFPPGVSYLNGVDPYPFMSWSTRLLPFLEQVALWQQTQEAFALDPRFLDNPPHVGLATYMAVFSCPADPHTSDVADLRGFKVAFTSYLGVEGTDQFHKDGMLFLDSRIRFSDVTDGTSTTLFVGERPPSTTGIFGWWYAGEGQSKDGSGDMVLGVQELYVSDWAPGCPPGPYAFGPGQVANQCDTFHYWSLHLGGGANFLLGDGSVHFLSYSAAPLMPALATRAGAEVVAPPD
jgi:hypothetical protein